MRIPSDMPRLKGFRFSREIIAYAVWAYIIVGGRSNDTRSGLIRS